MLINDRRRWVYLHNPKTAGMSLTTWLLERWPGEWRSLGDPAEFVACRRGDHDVHVVRRHSWNLPRDVLDYCTFCVVREPLERFASWYRFAKRSGFFPSSIDLTEFAFAQPLSLAPQSCYAELAHVVLRFEELPQCVGALPWVTDADLAAFPRLNVTDATDPSSFWTAESRRVIVDAYQPDFEVCGYPIPDCSQHG